MIARGMDGKMVPTETIRCKLAGSRENKTEILAEWDYNTPHARVSLARTLPLVQ
jgi:hypothetical protein